MKLENQIEQLAGLGLPLNDGVTVDDLLLSWSRNEYEQKPFDLVLYTYGMEIEEQPWGRFICDRAWNFDVECIEDNGDYATIVRNFHRITGAGKRLDDLSDRVDFEAKKASLRYKIDGTPREFEIDMDDDWADPATVEAIMNDMRGEGFDFYEKDNGQASVWFYMTPDNAHALNSLAANVFGLEKKPWWKIWQYQ